jgi:Sigma-70, region 4
VRYEVKESIGLAFAAALQHLPPRQRAALVLRDVLGFRTAEIAEMLASSEASVKGALRRARAYEYRGHIAIARFLDERGRLLGTPLRLVPTRANGQPAFGCYLQDPRPAILRSYGLMVLTPEGDRGLFPHFGLPRTLHE